MSHYIPNLSEFDDTIGIGGIISYPAHWFSDGVHTDLFNRLWMRAEGQKISVAEYPELTALLTEHRPDLIGVGFLQLPDFRGKHEAHLDDSWTIWVRVK